MNKPQAAVDLTKWFRLDFQEQCRIVESSKAGDTWVSNKTWRTATVVSNTRQGLTLKHESGRESRIQHHYFASEYRPKL